MLFSKEQRWIVWIFVAALLLSYFVMNRWLFTPIGTQSFGRLWQFYVSYTEFGFFRRGLIGSLLTLSGANSVLSNEYLTGYVMQHLAVLLLWFLVLRFMLLNRLVDPVLTIGIAFSPALFVHLGYNTGSLDAFVLVFALANILYTRSSVLFSLIVFAGILTHELFVFTIPAQLLAFAIRRGDLDVWPLLMPVLAGLAGCLLVWLQGHMDLTQDQMEEMLRQQIPTAADRHELWSGYGEINSSIRENIDQSITRLMGEIQQGYPYLVLPLLYLGLLVTRLSLLCGAGLQRRLLVLAALTPLTVTVLAFDYYRWVAVSCVLAIALTLVLLRDGAEPSRRLNLWILAFCLLAPLGTVGLERPFPMHQFVIERISAKLQP
ncbi:MAG: hypothetical protein AAGH74_05620 [Pseudomonadota bacterium]